MDEFSRLDVPLLIDRVLGLRCTTCDYQSDSGIQYSFNTGNKLNGLLLDLLQHTGQLPPARITTWISATCSSQHL
ncbi:hypothetical protein [Bacteroides sp. UBA939]|uniref:hypothetical protein n=1 Tax=Bacteroides sp. UBA939 TaxID=1946092 RepID=UPI0025C037F0|nr:hypothetical protein [Bacteroides sp. UBA939]